MATSFRLNSSLFSSSDLPSIFVTSRSYDAGNIDFSKGLLTRIYNVLTDEQIARIAGECVNDGLKHMAHMLGAEYNLSSYLDASVPDYKTRRQLCGRTGGMMSLSLMRNIKTKVISTNNNFNY